MAVHMPCLACLRIAAALRNAYSAGEAAAKESTGEASAAYLSGWLAYAATLAAKELEKHAKDHARSAP